MYWSKNMCFLLLLLSPRPWLRILWICRKRQLHPFGVCREKLLRLLESLCMWNVAIRKVFGLLCLSPADLKIMRVLPQPWLCSVIVYLMLINAEQWWTIQPPPPTASMSREMLLDGTQLTKTTSHRCLEHFWLDFTASPSSSSLSSPSSSLLPS